MCDHHERIGDRKGITPPPGTESLAGSGCIDLSLGTLRRSHGEITGADCREHGCWQRWDLCAIRVL